MATLQRGGVAADVCRRSELTGDGNAACSASEQGWSTSSLQYPLSGPRRVLSARPVLRMGAGGSLSRSDRSGFRRRQRGPPDEHAAGRDLLYHDGDRLYCLLALLL